MKNKLAVTFGVLACVVINLFGQTGDTPYEVVERGANHRVWERTALEYSVSGDIVPRTHRYTELATGLNYQNALGEWVEAVEVIEPLATGGAAALQGQHQVYFPYDIYPGVIQIATPEGKVLQSRPLGLSYDDGARTVLIAELKPAAGQLLNSNQVIYVDAFKGFRADVRYTYTKAGFEQDIVLREQPPAPADYGLNPQTTHLQVLTEFFETPEPKSVAQSGHGNNGRQGQDDDLVDTTLDFGGMEMVAGQAFFVVDSLKEEIIKLHRTKHSEKGKRVYKTWIKLEGRTFLIEEVPLENILPDLQKLPQSSRRASLNKSIGNNVASVARELPARRQVVKAGGKSLPLAQMDWNRQSGLVMDYNLVNTGQTNYTFKGDTTYYISGTVNLSGTNTFEGGTVLKYAPINMTNLASSSVNLMSGSIFNCQTSPYRPAVFTAKDDDTVGEAISGSTANPSGYYAYPALTFNSSATVSNFRIAWANEAISAQGGSVLINHGQLINCSSGIYYLLSQPLTVQNLLFASVTSPFIDTSLTTNLVVSVGNSTFSGSAQLATGGNLRLTNCILANVTNAANAGAYVSGDHNGFYKSPVFGTSQITNTFYPFQTAGAGSYYLTNGCAFRNAGIITINTTLLASLRQKTTRTPQWYSDAWIDSNTTLGLLVARDTNAASVDLGYHYDPLDYYFDSYTVLFAGTLTLTNGVQVGFGGPFYIEPGASLVSRGKADALNRLVQCRTVQEEAIYWAGDPTLSSDSVYCSSTVTCRFTEFSRLAGPGGHVSDDYKGGIWNFQDCQFRGAQMAFVGGACTLNAGLTNCLFERTKLYVSGTNVTLFAYNNLFYQGDVWLSSSNSANAFTFRDNYFYQNNLTNWIASGVLNNDHNAYVTNYNSLTGTESGRVTVSNFTFQTSWLGTYYQPTNSPLADVGSRYATNAGLYHYTVTANQMKEAGTIVDIGYHYVATDANGNPIDSNGDGISDYLADKNGNGVTDVGESSWAVAPAITVQPTNQTANAGNLVSFSVAATGTAPLSYQWQFNGTNIVGATSSTYYLVSVMPTNAGGYRVTVGNAAGSQVISSNALLTVLTPPIITVQPTSVTVLDGSNATISVTASSLAQLSYQWWFNSTTLLVGATNSTLVLTNVLFAQAGIYAVVVTNVAGYAVSSNALLTVASMIISVPPTNQPVVSGGNVTFAVVVSATAACAGPYTYQWLHEGTNISVNNDTITTVAGNGVIGYSGDGGLATNANLADPFGGAMDAAGTLYVADNGASVIRAVDTNGIITTVAGNGSFGYSGDGGLAIYASLGSPNGVAVDATGNLYFSDNSENVIRKVSTNGIITTVAGNGTAGYTGDGGSATNASLAYPSGMAVDVSGNLYFADRGNYCVRKVGTNGIITTVAGNGSYGYSGDDGPATNANLSYVYGVAVDAGGNVYITDSGNYRIREVGVNGIIITVAGNGSYGYSGDGGSATNANLSSPQGVAVDASGDFYIADSGNDVIREVSTDGTITTVAGNGSYGYSGDGGSATNASFGYPVGVTVGAAGQAIYVADSNDGVIRKIIRKLVFNAPVFTLFDITNSDAGNYQVILTSACGSVTSSVVAVLILPAITTQPSSQVVFQGGSATFNETATSMTTLYYQWKYNGTNLIAGATNALLTLGNVQPSQDGNYSVAVRNLAGTVISSNAQLTVDIPQPFSGLLFKVIITQPNASSALP